MAEALIRVDPDSTGARVRTRTVNITFDDGTFAAVNMEVVSIADKKGNMIDLDIAAGIGEMLRVMTEIRDILILSKGRL